jgi:hypothetical protein
VERSPFGLIVIWIAYQAAVKGLLGMSLGELILVIIVLVFAACGLLIDRLGGQTFATLGGAALGYIFGRCARTLPKS